MLPVKVRRDPAPSRVKYRLQRLWLTPAIRNLVRIGLPLGALLGLVLSIALNPDVQAWSKAQTAALRQQVASHPGLMVTNIVLDDMSPDMATALKDNMDLSLPVSSMDLDLSLLHEKITAIEAVAAAHVRIEGGGLLKISVTEREPKVLWRSAEGLKLIDAEGMRLGVIPNRAVRPDLPILVGEGANKAVAEALVLLDLAQPIAGDIRALRRVGARRWTIALQDGPRILLPEVGAAEALARVMALHDADDILSRDLVAVDMRDGRRPILRLSADALYQLRRARGLIGEEDT